MISPRDHVSLPVFLPNLCRLGRTFFGRSLFQVMTAVKHAEALSQIGQAEAFKQEGNNRFKVRRTQRSVDSEIPERRWIFGFWIYFMFGDMLIVFETNHKNV